MNAYGFGMFGMGGIITDPGESGFCARVRDELGVNIGQSPYQDYQTNDIIAAINALPSDAIVLIWGTSLGSNNAPYVAANLKRPVHGVWGFQASIYGYHSSLSANVKFAHLIYSYNFIPFPGLGAYIWQDGTIDPATYHKTRKDLPHPGDGDKDSQDMFLAEMKRVIEHGNAS